MSVGDIMKQRVKVWWADLLFDLLLAGGIGLLIVVVGMVWIIGTAL
jgi:hypothetical protein